MIAHPDTINLATLRARADAARKRLDPARPADLDPWGAMLYDEHQSPRLPQRELLAAIGIAADAPLGDLILGLAAWGVYLVNTDHLADSALHERLGPILEEPVPMHGATTCAEFIDLNPFGIAERQADRDRSLPRPEWRTA